MSLIAGTFTKNTKTGFWICLKNRKEIIIKVFRKNLKKILKTDLVKVSALNGCANCVQIATSLASNKIIAMYVGPAGTALLGQLNNFILIAVSFASFGIRNGMTKLIAEFRADASRRRFILSTGFFLTLVGSLGVSGAVFAGRQYLSESLLRSREYSGVFTVFSVSLFFFGLNSFFTSVLNGFKDIKKVVAINIATSLISLAVTVFLIILYGIYGALLVVMVTHMVVFFVILALVCRVHWFRLHEFFAGIDGCVVAKLLHYSLMTFTVMFAVIFVQIQIRDYLIREVSLVGAGYWQGINRLGEVYLTFVIATMGSYYLPRLSEIKNNVELRSEVVKGGVFWLPVTLLISSALFFYRDLIVSVLFTPAFEPMKALFLFQFLGVILKVASLLLGFIMIAKAMTLAYIIIELSLGALYYFATIFFVRMYGIIGVTYAYALINLLYLLVVIFMFKNLILKAESRFFKAAGSYSA